MKFKFHAMTLGPGQNPQTYFSELKQNICPHCHKEITAHQTGHCVYGSCGHRLFQGKLLSMEKE